MSLIQSQSSYRFNNVRPTSKHGYLALNWENKKERKKIVGQEKINKLYEQYIK